MQKLILLFGPQATGKMTVAQDVCSSNNFGMIHNHMIIDMMKHLYGYGTDAFHKERVNITNFLLLSALSNNVDMILTKTFNFNDENDINYFNNINSFVDENIIKFYLIELSSDLKTRLARNKTDNRLKNKPSKRDVNLSDKRLIQTDKTFNYVLPHEYAKKNHYLQIDNSNLSVTDTTNKIIKFIQ